MIDFLWFSLNFNFLDAVSRFKMMQNGQRKYKSFLFYDIYLCDFYVLGLVWWCLSYLFMKIKINKRNEEENYPIWFWQLFCCGIKIFFSTKSALKKECRKFWRFVISLWINWLKNSFTLEWRWGILGIFWFFFLLEKKWGKWVRSWIFYRSIKHKNFGFRFIIILVVNSTWWHGWP